MPDGLGAFTRTMKRLLPHQSQALRRIVGRPTAFLAMEMRLGKTLTALRWLQTLPSPYPCLVVAPLAVLPGWEREAAEEGLRVCYLAGHSKAQQIELTTSLDAAIYLTNYESLILPGQRNARGRAVATPSGLLARPWKAMVLDESTRIRNPQAQITKVLRASAGSVEYRLGLSGLPNPEHPLDLFEQMCWTHGRWAGVRNYWEGRNRYFTKQPWNWDWTCSSEDRATLKRAFHEAAVVLSRKDVGLKVEPAHQTLYCELPKKVRQAYDSAEKNWELGTSVTAWAPVAAGWLNQLTGGFPKNQEQFDSPHKMKLLLDVLQGRVAPEWEGQPTVVWFRFTREIEAAVKALSKFKVRCLTGATTTPERRRLERDFRAGRFQILIGQERCGRFGLDLSSSSLVIHYSHSYEYETYKQVLDRTEHPLKKTPTQHLHLVARDTIDEDLAEIRSQKGLISAAFRTQFETKLRRRLSHA